MVNLSIYSRRGTFRWICFMACWLPALPWVIGTFGFRAFAQGAKEKPTVRVTALPFVSFMPLHIGLDQGLFDAENVRVVLKSFNAPPEATAALMANEVDTNPANDESILNIILRGLEIRAIFPQNVVKKENKFQAIVVRKDLYEKGLRDPRDLKGKSIAWVTGGRALLPFAAHRTMEKFGIDMSKDMNISKIRENPAKVAAIEKGALDAGLFTEPWVTLVTSRGLAVPIAYVNTPEGLPNSMLGFKADFLKANRDAVLSFLKGYIKAVDVYVKAQEDLVQKRRFAEKYAKTFGLDVDEMVKMAWSELSRDGKFATEAVQEWMDWAAAGGSVKGRVKVEQWYDPSFIEELRKQGILK